MNKFFGKIAQKCEDFLTVSKIRADPKIDDMLRWIQTKAKDHMYNHPSQLMFDISKPLRLRKLTKKKAVEVALRVKNYAKSLIKNDPTFKRFMVLEMQSSKLKRANPEIDEISVNCP